MVHAVFGSEWIMRIKVKIPIGCFPPSEERRKYNGQEIVVDVYDIMLPNGSILGVYNEDLGIEIITDQHWRATSLRDLIGQDIARLELK